MVKITVVALAGASAAVHAGAQSKAVLAVFGALGGLTSIAAVVLGLMLHG
jgi:hypothetical protein